MQGGGAKRYENRPASPAPPQKARTTRGAKSGKRPKWPRAIWKIYMMKEHDETTTACIVSSQPATKILLKWTHPCLLLVDSYSRKNWLCYNRERVSELFTAHEDTPQESESYGQLLGGCTIVYSSRYVRRLHKIFVICSKQCGTELNWQKHIFRLLIPKYHLREMNEKYHLREMNKNSATENYYDNIQY